MYVLCPLCYLQVSQIEKNFEQKESKLLLQQREDLKRVELQAENELREVTASLLTTWQASCLSCEAGDFINVENFIIEERA